MLTMTEYRCPSGVVRYINHYNGVLIWLTSVDLQFIDRDRFHFDSVRFNDGHLVTFNEELVPAIPNVKINSTRVEKIRYERRKATTVDESESVSFSGLSSDDCKVCGWAHIPTSKTIDECNIRIPIHPS